MRTVFLGALLALAASATAAAPRTAVYSMRPDPRMCPSPMCGGWWISRVNHPTMRCVDGTVAAACYVAEIDWSGLGLPPADEAWLVGEAASERVLARGWLYPVPFGAMTLGGLSVERAWTEIP